MKIALLQLEVQMVQNHMLAVAEGDVAKFNDRRCCLDTAGLTRLLPLLCFLTHDPGIPGLLSSLLFLPQKFINPLHTCNG